MADLDSSGYREDWVGPGVICGVVSCGGSGDNNNMIIIKVLSTLRHASS